MKPPRPKAGGRESRRVAGLLWVFLLLGLLAVGVATVYAATPNCAGSTGCEGAAHPGQEVFPADKYEH